MQQLATGLLTSGDNATNLTRYSELASVQQNYLQQMGALWVKRTNGSWRLSKDECASAAFAALLKSYRVSRVTGDRYAGESERELVRKHGIAYDLAKQTKSELFRDLLPLLNSGRIFLPRNDRLQGQIVGLERRTSAVGRDTISHPDRGHDDVANAVAGAAALSKFGGYDTSLRWVSGDDDDWTAKTPVGFL
jgi:hypothetical protein